MNRSTTSSAVAIVTELLASVSADSSSSPGSSAVPPPIDGDDDVSLPAIPCSNGWFFFVVYGPLYAAACGFGLVGNTLSFCVLHRCSSHSPTGSSGGASGGSGSVSTFLLKSLAVSDNIFLSAAAFVQMYPALAIFVGATEHFKAVYPWYQTIAWPVAHMVQVGTVWMMVLVASNRYMAVCQPLHAQRLCTKRKVQIQIALIGVFSVVYNLPRFAEYRYVYENVTDALDNSTRLSDRNLGLASYVVYNIVYENIAYCLFAFLLPLSVLIFFNTHLLRALKRSRRLRKTTVRRGTRRRTSDENNVTLVMVVIIVNFILFQTPASANQILYYVADDASKTTCSPYMMYYHLSNLLITVNSSSNFVIYCLFRRQFQRQLRCLMCPPSTVGSSSSTSTRGLRQWQTKPLPPVLTATELGWWQNAGLSVSESVVSVGACQTAEVTLTLDVE